MAAKSRYTKKYSSPLPWLQNSFYSLNAIVEPMQALQERFRAAWDHSGFQKYFRNTSWIFFGKIGSMAISFLATLYIARMLGPTNYGELSYAVSFVALFGFIASVGTDTVVYRDLMRSQEERAKILGTALTIRIIAGTITWIAATSIAFALLHDDISSILVGILSSAFILNSFQIILFEFQTRANTKYPSIAAIVIALILNLLKVMVIFFHKGVIYLAIVLLMESVLYAIAYLYLYAKSYDDPLTTWRFDIRYARSLLLDSIPLIALGAFSIIYARIDQVFIRHLIDVRSVGIYDAAVRVAEVWTFIPGILLASLSPAIMHARAVSQDLYNRRLGRLTLLFLGIAIIIALFVSLTAPFIMRVLFGEAFIGGVIVLKVYVWAFLGTSMGIVITQYLIIENDRRILATIGFFPTALNVLLNLLWIPRYGIEGSAYATLISYSMTPFMLLLFESTRARTYAVYRALLAS